MYNGTKGAASQNIFQVNGNTDVSLLNKNP